MERPLPPDQPERVAPAGPQAPPGGGWQQPIPHHGLGWVGRPLASWGSRVAAWFVDGLIIGIPATVIFVVLVAGAIGVTGDDSDPSLWGLIGGAVLSTLIFAVIAIIY